MRSYLIALLLALSADVVISQASKFKMDTQPERAEVCRVCSALNEDQCHALMKEIIREMKPRARLQALSSVLKSDSCFGMNDLDCATVTLNAISKLGWDYVAKTLMDECFLGEVVLSNPHVMRFEFSSIHSQRSSNLPMAESNRNSEKLIGMWRDNCPVCFDTPPGKYDGDDSCAQQLLLTFSGLSEAERLEIFKQVFSDQSCINLASSDAECLQVFESQLSRAHGTDRKAFAFKACAEGLLGHEKHVLASVSARASKPDVSNLVSNCPACGKSEDASSCASRLYNGFSHLSDDLRQLAFSGGLIRDSLVTKACGDDGVSSTCLTKLDGYLKMLNNVKVSKTLKGATTEQSIDTSLLNACAQGKLHPAVIQLSSYTASYAVSAAVNDWTAAMKQYEETRKLKDSLAVEANNSSKLQPNHVFAVNAAVRDWDRAMKQMAMRNNPSEAVEKERVIAQNSVLVKLADTFSKLNYGVLEAKTLYTAADNSACALCDGLTDKDCLSLLDAKVASLANPERLVVYKSIFVEEAKGCWAGHLDADAQCLQMLQILYDGLSDKTRLSSLVKSCSYGFLNDDYQAPDISTNDVIPSYPYMMNFSEEPPTMSKSTPIFIFTISASMAIMIGLMVSFVVRKRRVQLAKRPGATRLGPIYEYASLE